MVKKLSIAFVWHMHQPMYKPNSVSDYLMPWVRMHAIKDYLDMLLLTTEFPNIKQTFNLLGLKCLIIIIKFTIITFSTTHTIK